MNEYYVYLLTNKRNGTLYTGSTSDLVKRVWEHKNKVIEGFTAQYEVARLVYYEICDDINSAIERENQIKRWRRKWKLELIEKQNPHWVDLYQEITS
ncbi:MAG: GIY-YIG nuclease family protein [Candidatus Berkiellales bacterium]